MARHMTMRMAMMIAVGVTALFSGVSTTGAATPRASWAVRSAAEPTNFATEDTPNCESFIRTCDSYNVSVTNVGTRASEGLIVIRDKLPAGIEAVGVAFHKEREPGSVDTHNIECNVEPSLVTCTFEEPVSPAGVMQIRMDVIATPAAAEGVTNHVEVEGGAALAAVSGEPATVPNAVTLSGPPPAPTFGIQDLGAGVLGADGVSDFQAGDHPSTVTTTSDVNTLINKINPGEILHFAAAQEPKTEIVDLPAGLVGNALVTPRCPASFVVESKFHPEERCPASSRVGTVAVEDNGSRVEVLSLYNVVPEAGYPAEFGFEFDETVILLRARVLPTAAGYVVSVVAANLPRSQTLKVTGARVTFFGDPAERNGGGHGEAFFSNPTACGAKPLTMRMEMDSWVDPSNWQSKETTMYGASPAQGVTGCGALRFEPAIAVSPETSTRDTPSGYEIDMKVPQTPNIYPNLATPHLKDATVRLPEGIGVSPSSANGIVVCQERGGEGIELGNKNRLANENRVEEGEEEGPDGVVHPARGHCPQASQVGDVEVITPLLSGPLHGHVYVAAPRCGGEGQPACTEASASNGELFGLYIEVAGSGVVMKFRGTVSANPVTGQLATTFKELPQLPFSELKVRLNGGQRAPLANPQSCGLATTRSDLTPWSTPATPDALPSSSFTVGGCASPTPFAPSFSAGTVSPKAASSSPFTTTLTRQDGEQNIIGVRVTTPLGLVGLISQVPLCQEPDASSGTCSEASAIGTTTAAAGAGANPYWTSGKVYLTGPYHGAPFGLTVVVPAKAGPFNLGNVVVRAAINVDPATAAVTITSGPIPQIKDGVAFRLRTINVTVDRPGFILSPSNCSPQSVTASIAGSEGATADVSTPFGLEGCKSLPFAPSFVATTQAKTSKANGASLDVKVGYPAGFEANIKAVKVSLPIALPSRLTTLQKACLAAVFASNPASCPPESVIGIAKARTPVLPATLTGPAYLVSHGGEAFPNLVIVLQGDGVRVDLIGNTDIKKGITSTIFKNVPDAPVSAFELYLPQGKFSALTAYGSLCAKKLVMPTIITGQNGAVIKQNTPLKVTGCPKAKKPAKKVKQKAKSGRTARERHTAATVKRGRQ